MAYQPASKQRPLRTMKRLHEKNLIDDAEYQQKRKDLLDQYLQ